jgi:hypothetical protein
MNRRQRRASITTDRYRYSKPDDCPCCNVRKAFVSLLQHGDELCGADGAPVLYGLEADPGNESMVAEFGVLQIHVYAKGERFEVTSFGDKVFQMTPDGFEVLREGGWLKTLAAIQADLTQRFGPVDLGGGTRPLH